MLNKLLYPVEIGSFPAYHYKWEIDFCLVECLDDTQQVFPFLDGTHIKQIFVRQVELLLSKMHGFFADPPVKLMVTSLVYHPDPAFIYPQEAYNILFGLFADCNNSGCRPGSIPDFLLVYFAVEGPIHFGMFHENQVMNGDDRSDTAMVDPVREFVAQAVIQINGVPVEPVSEPESAPQ